MLRKLAHTAYIEKKDQREAVHLYLLTYQATPCSATGKSPAELLLYQPISTTMPVFQPLISHKELQTSNKQYKSLVKHYHDARRHAKTSHIKPGDEVLVQQRKSITTQPFFNPKPLTVTKKKGTMVTAECNRRTVNRDVFKFKWVVPCKLEL